jgi:hypothetical protein
MHRMVSNLLGNAPKSRCAGGSGMTGIGIWYSPAICAVPIAGCLAPTRGADQVVLCAGRDDGWIRSLTPS